jgi:hypothetical protein
MINVFPPLSGGKHTERFDLVFARVHALHGCDTGGIVTVMYAAVANTNAAIGFVPPKI